MTDQDHVNERNCCLVIKGGQLTAQTLALAMRAFLAADKRVTHHPVKHGKQSVKQLATQGGKMENIQVCGKSIKEFESVAQKYAVDYAVMKDYSEETPKHLVFFKSKDAETMSAAFREYSAKQFCKDKEKPSLMQNLLKMMGKVKAQPQLEQNKERDLETER